MKKFIPCLLIVLTFACASKKNKKTSASREFENTTIEMSKSACFGPCPIYNITLNEKGEVSYNGKQHVDKIGKYRKQITPEEALTIIKAFNADFWAFENEYTAAVTDMPTTTVTFTVDKKTKTVIDYFGAPAKLKELEKLLQNIAESPDGWQKEANDN